MPDRRIRKTKKAVHDALLQLLSEKEMADITVLELTKRADINRKTFYNHYTDLYAVLDELEDMLVDRLMADLESLLIDQKTNEPMELEKIEQHMQEFAYPHFQMLIKDLQSEPSFYSIFNHCGDRARLREKIVHREKKLFIQIYGGKGCPVWLDYLLLFVVNGSMAVYENWMKEEERVSADDLARFFGMLFTTQSVSSFLREEMLDSQK